MPSIPDLIQDIEKRMIALGYEDFEELHNLDHDAKSLAVLKRRLMDEAREMRELKKQKSRIPKGLKDILSKLTKIYKNDLYIYNARFVIPGNTSQESLKGRFIVTMKDEYVEFMETICPHDTMIYIKDISELKKLVDAFPTMAEAIYPNGLETKIIQIETNRLESLKEKMNEELEYIKIDTEHFIPLIIDDENDPEIITLKKKFDIQFKEYPNIEANIQLFPLYTEKEKPFIEFMSDFYNQNSGITLYYARFHMSHTFFDTYFKILYF